MAEANGIFVKIFRDKEKFEELRARLELKKNKWEAEKEYRVQLAKASLLAGSNLDAQIPKNFGAEFLAAYPYFRDNNKTEEYLIWISHFGTFGNYKMAHWPDINNVYLPVEVLEEMRSVIELKIFEAVRLFYSDNAWLLVGGTTWDGARWLIAYWGEKKYYDKIQEKIRELKEKQEDKKVKEEEIGNSKTDGKWVGLSGLVGLLVFSALLIYGTLTRPFYQTVKPASVETKNPNLKEEKSEEAKKIGETKKADEKKQIDEGELWARQVCVLCGSRPEESVYTLETGRVYRKESLDCKKGGKHYFLDYEIDEGGRVRHRSVEVTESIFNKVKVGDKVPFKRLEY